MIAFADAVPDLLAVALVHGTVLAAAAWLLSVTLLRRARPAAIVALWTVVLLKFLVPFGPGARYSLASLVAGVAGLGDEPAPAPEPIVVTAPAPGARLLPPPAPEVPWLALAGSAAWLAVAGALTVRQVRRARAARRRALAADAAPAWLVDETAALARRLGLRRRRFTVRVGADTAPYLVGLVRPIVVVPAALLAGDQAAARRAVLAHELAHVRRGDAALRLLQAAAATLFFFWPVVRLVNRRIDLAREQACDAWAVAVGPLSARAYARMLVDAARAAHGHAPAAGLAVFGFGRRGGQLRHRVDALCDRAPGAGVGVAGALAVAAFAAVGLTGAAPARAEAPRPRVCLFTPEVASSIMASFPEADVDGDGTLSRTEVCDFQAEMRRRVVEDARALAPADAAALASVLDEGSPLASDELCCNCPDPAAAGGAVSAETSEVSTAIPTCSRGVDP